MKNKKKITHQSEKLKAILRNTWRWIISGIVIFLFVLGLGYGAFRIYSKFQNERQLKESQNAEVLQQMKVFIEEVDILKQEKEDLSAKLQQESIGQSIKSTTTPTTQVIKKTAGCDQKMLDAYSKTALNQGFSKVDVDSFIAMEKANNCRVFPTDNNSNAINEINRKLDSIQFCQSTGICP